MKRLLLTVMLLGTIATNTHAGIIKIDITGRQTAFNGKSFGAIGTYEVLKGKLYGEVDPRLPQNAVITDIQLAPRNAKGMVEYSADFYMLKPTDLSKGNHKLFVELPNRGGKPFGSFNKSRGGNDPGASDQPDDAFLMNMGYTMVWCGWDISATTGLTITVPVAVNKNGSAITGPSYEYISFDNGNTQSYKLTYPAVTADKKSAVLTQRALLNDAPKVLAATDWEFTDEHTIRLLPAGTAFKSSYIYDFVYTATAPKVAGLGLCSTRDFISFLRYANADASGNANPLAGDVQYTFSFASSQPARYMNDMQTLGFNVDEQGHRVIDGILNWLGGGSGVGINYRFAQPGRTERNRQNHLYPEGIFPFAYPILTDKLTGKTGGRLAGYKNVTNRPKDMEVNSANEYWVKAASLLHSDTQGNDLPDPENVRFYLLSGMQHGTGSGTSKGSGQQFQNPTHPDAALRALFMALDAWVTNGIKPPDSEVPRRTNGTAALATAHPGVLTGNVDQKEIGWPNIPGVTYTGLITTRYAYNFGPDFKNGIIAKYPIDKISAPAYTNFVSKVDADGNEIAGIRQPPVAAPTGTLTGWALRREGFGLNDGAESAGQYIPFKKTKTERLAAGDRRLSLEERYVNHAGYVAAVTKAVRDLQARRLLLPDDSAAYIKEAEESSILR